MILQFFVINFFVQLVFIGLAVLFEMAQTGYIMMSMGLWPVVMCEIVIECNREPELERPFCCCPFALKAKWHPWAYLLIFAVINFEGSISIVAGFIVGYLYVIGILNFTVVGCDTAQSFENSCLCCLTSNSNFITQANAGSGTLLGGQIINSGVGIPNYI
jgi:hypothetical protein